MLEMIEESASRSQNALDKMISTVPSSLDTIYDKILLQSKNVASAKKLLHIILATAQPLSLKQLNIAFCIQEHHQSFTDLRKNLEPDIETTIKDLCGLFVRVLIDMYIWFTRLQKNSL